MMMMIGDPPPRSNPTVQVPPWDLVDNHPTANMQSLSPNGNGGGCSYDLPFEDSWAALHRYLPSNTEPDEVVSVGDDFDVPVDAFSCDHFRMFEFKVRKCSRARSHDWTDCPYAHPGEKARRRDPRRYNYSGSPCPEFRKGSCRRGDSCDFAHGVFECWLHPARYRTQPCKDGTQCRRRVCFFAHTHDQLRVLPQQVAGSYDGSTTRPVKCGSFGSSPTSVIYSPPPSPTSDSPPISPSEEELSSSSVSGLTRSMRNLQIANVRMCLGVGGSPRGINSIGSGFCSPRSPTSKRPGFMSLPVTPTRIPGRYSQSVFDLWDRECREGGEPAMERVESGRDLRAKIYAKLSKENSLDSNDQIPDLGWVAELVK